MYIVYASVEYEDTALPGLQNRWCKVPSDI